MVDGDRAARVEDQARPGLDPDTHMGPLVSEEQLNRVCGYLGIGAKEGAEAMVGGKAARTEGYFVEPTVLVNTNREMKVVSEEIFGPVVAAIPFERRDDLVRRRPTTTFTDWQPASGRATSTKRTDRRGVARRNRVDQLL